MNDISDIIYHYDPEQESAIPAEPGVTAGYLVVRLFGREAVVADAAMLVDGSGVAAIEVTSDFQPTQIVDDTP